MALARVDSGKCHARAALTRAPPTELTDSPQPPPPAAVAPARTGSSSRPPLSPACVSSTTFTFPLPPSAFATHTHSQGRTPSTSPPPSTCGYKNTILMMLLPAGGAVLPALAASRRTCCGASSSGPHGSRTRYAGTPLPAQSAPAWPSVCGSLSRLKTVCMRTPRTHRAFSARQCRRQQAAVVAASGRPEACQSPRHDEDLAGQDQQQLLDRWGLGGPGQVCAETRAATQHRRRGAMPACPLHGRPALGAAVP